VRFANGDDSPHEGDRPAVGGEDDYLGAWIASVGEKDAGIPIDSRFDREIDVEQCPDGRRLGVARLIEAPDGSPGVR
jgi:hypothetical protein